jgi:1-acyl-sn-glycerol-3-phosphate acyltransferase
MNIIKSIIVWLTVICFLIVLFPFTFIIWILVFPFDRERVIIHWILVYQGLIISRFIPMWKIDIDGREKAVRGTTYIIVANHQSLLDVLILSCLRYKFKWISKIENVKVPILGWYLKMADYIIVNRGNEESKAEMLEKSYRCLKRGISIMIFSEGTRSLTGGIGFFKRGAFQLALETGVTILPVVLDGTGSLLPKHGLILGSRSEVKIKVLDPVNPQSFGTDKPEELALKIQSLMTSELKELRNRKDCR